MSDQVLSKLIELATKALEERHSPWELGDCRDWPNPSEKQYVRMGCDFIVEPPTHPGDTGEKRMAYIAACDPATLLPLLQELLLRREADEPRPDQRGPLRTIVRVVRVPGAPLKVTLECGHTDEYPHHALYRLGVQINCQQCREAEQRGLEAL